MITKFQIHDLFPHSETINKPRDILVYHGTKKYFEDFDSKKLGSGTATDYLSLLGFHFTEDWEVAKRFIDMNGKTNRILTCELHLKKTLKITEIGLVLGMLKYNIEELGMDLGYINRDYNEVKNMIYYNHSNPYDEDTIYQVLIEMEDHYSPKKYVSQFKKDILIKNGYDSIEYLNQVEVEKGKYRYDFVALKPSIIEIIRDSNI